MRPSAPEFSSAARDGGVATRLTALLDGPRGALLAALFVLAAAMPGLLALPPLDPGEARAAQVAAQMLESGDLVIPRFQAQPLRRTGIGLYGLEAASVRLVSSVEARDIRADRLPSLLAAMLAAAACVWGARALVAPAPAALSGAGFGASFLLCGEAHVAGAGPLAAGGTVLAMAALARIYGEARGGGPAGRAARPAFWAGLALALATAGPAGPAMALAALLALGLADRDLGWARTLGWTWGLLLLAAVAGPWALAVSVVTDAGFWRAPPYGESATALGLAAPAGRLAALGRVPLLAFPLTAVAPLAIVAARRLQGAPGVRFALAWLLPGSGVGLIAPGLMIETAAALLAPLAWLVAAGLGLRAAAWTRWSGALAAAGCGVVCAALIVGTSRGAEGVGAVAVACAALLALAAGLSPAGLLLAGRPACALAAGALLAAAAQATFWGAAAPRLDRLWVSTRAVALLARADLDPRNGVTPGPVAVLGYAEPSLVFALGSETELDDAPHAADALAEGQPVLVEDRAADAFAAELARDGLKARAVGSVSGDDYAARRPVRLTLWRRAP